jgi:hypothetical protein
MHANSPPHCLTKRARVRKYMSLTRQLRSESVDILSYAVSHLDTAAYIKTLSLSVALHVDSLIVGSSPSSPSIRETFVVCTLHTVLLNTR